MKDDLSRYRLENSKSMLESAEILFKSNKYKDSISRAYYAMFSAARALLSTERLDSAKHSGVISLFNQHFVKPGTVNKNLGKYLNEARSLREKSDYADFVVVSREEARAQIDAAQEFIREIERVLAIP